MIKYINLKNDFLKRRNIKKKEKIVKIVFGNDKRSKYY